MASSGEKGLASDYNEVKVMLEESLGGLSLAQLQRSLNDPIDDSVLRPDENRQSTEVGYLKLLRNSLKETFAAETRKVEREIITKFDTMMRRQGTRVE